MPLPEWGFTLFLHRTKLFLLHFSGQVFIQSDVLWHQTVTVIHRASYRETLLSNAKGFEYFWKRKDFKGISIYFNFQRHCHLFCGSLVNRGSFRPSEKKKVITKWKIEILLKKYTGCFPLHNRLKYKERFLCVFVCVSSPPFLL